MKEQDHPPWWIRVIFQGGNAPKRQGGYPSIVRVLADSLKANLGARSEGALSWIFNSIKLCYILQNILFEFHINLKLEYKDAY